MTENRGRRPLGLGLRQVKGLFLWRLHFLIHTWNVFLLLSRNLEDDHLPDPKEDIEVQI